MTELSLILYDVRSVHNVGSMFRTADGAGVARIYLTGTTPTPIDRFGRARNDIAKVALGAEHRVPWEYHSSAKVLVALLKERGVRLIALEQDARSQPYDTYALTGPSALVVGSEVEGLDPEVLAACDDVLELPMLGSKESLNVSVAAGIALYALRASSGMSLSTS